MSMCENNVKRNAIRKKIWHNAQIWTVSGIPIIPIIRTAFALGMLFMALIKKLWKITIIFATLVIVVAYAIMLYPIILTRIP